MKERKIYCKICKLQKLSILLFISIISFFNNNIKIMYYISDNLGDNLNYYILNKITRFKKFQFYDIKMNKSGAKIIDEKNIKKLDEIAKTDLFFIGSILNVICNWRYRFQIENNKYKSIINKWYFKFYEFFHPLIIFGSGFSSLKYENESYIRNIKIIAVRGNISLQRLKKNKITVSNSVVLADPGLLFPIIFKFKKLNSVKKYYNLCIIPHYVDQNNTLIKSKIKVKQSMILNIKENPFKFIKTLSKCKRVLSSSLHGLIISDSLAIPNLRIVASNKIIGGDYKFRDYYSAYGLKIPLQFNLNKTTFTEKQLKIIDSNYNISLDIIKKKQCQLLIKFPYRLNKELYIYKKTCIKRYINF